MLEHKDGIIRGFRIDNVSCECPEQAFSVAVEEDVVKFRYLMQDSARKVLEHTNYNTMRELFPKPKAAARYARSQLSTSDFFPADDSQVTKCLVMEATYDKDTFENIGRIQIYTQNAAVAAYTFDETNHVAIKQTELTETNPELASQVDLIQKMAQSQGLSNRPISSMRRLGVVAGLLEQVHFGQYGQENNLPLMQRATTGLSDIVVARRPSELVDENKHGAGTAPMRVEEDMANWVMALMHENGQQVMGYNQMAKLATAKNQGVQTQQENETKLAHVKELHARKWKMA